jgi:adenylate kinase
MIKDIFFLGIQGCGKGTQAKLLLKDLPNHRYFEMGQTLRSIMSGNNMIGNYIRDIVNSGKMIDNFITHDLIHTGLKIAEKNKKYIVIDGFPRLFEQAEYFSKKMDQMERDFVVIHLELPKEVALQRMVKRAEIEGRKDDTPEAMQQRIDIFTKETTKVIKHFDELSKVITIDAN